MKAIKYALLMIAMYHAPSLAVEYEVIPGTSLRVNSAIPGLAYDFATKETIPWPAGGAGAAGVKEGYHLTVPGGPKIPVSVTHTLPRGAVGRAAGGLLRFAGPIGVITNAISLGMLIWDETQNKWVLPADGFSQSDGFVQGKVWSLNVYPYDYSYRSAEAACMANGFVGVIVDGPADAFGDCVFNYDTNPPPKYNDRVRAINCPAGSTVDSCVPGFVPPQSPATDAQIDQAVTDGIGTDSNKADAVAEAAQSNGYPPMADGTPSASGPELIVGPTASRVISGPDGDTVINSSTVYNITYQGDVVNVGQTTTTTTTKPDGSTTTETQSNAPPSVPAGSTVPAATVNLKLPDDYAREKTTQGILSKLTGIFDWIKEPVQPEATPPMPASPIQEVQPPGGIGDINGYLSDLDETAACPGDYTIAILGANVVLPMGPFCDLADLARPLNLVFFSIFALLAFFRIYTR